MTEDPPLEPGAAPYLYQPTFDISSGISIMLLSSSPTGIIGATILNLESVLFLRLPLVLKWVEVEQLLYLLFPLVEESPLD